MVLDLLLTVITWILNSLSVSIDVFGYSFNLVDLVILTALVFIGLLIIVFVVKLLLVFFPAIIIAVVVWFLTGGSLFWAGVAFLVVAIVSIARRI